MKIQIRGQMISGLATRKILWWLERGLLIM
jgi:hypothetical protein